jgi:L-lactate dehydrogenase (cytochrome)
MDTLITANSRRQPHDKKSARMSILTPHDHAGPQVVAVSPEQEAEWPAPSVPDAHGPQVAPAVPFDPQRRRLPSVRQLRSALRFRPAAKTVVERRLAGVETVEDLASIAKHRVPAAVFEYVHGAAEGHVSLRRARDAFDRAEFDPRVLHNVEDVDLSTTILGRDAKLPLILAPTAFNRLMEHHGEPAVARAAQRAGVPYSLSTMGTTSIEYLTQAAPQADLWFQLTIRKDRDAAAELVDRAAAAGWNALVLGVDTPAVGHRRDASRHGMSIPPRLTPKTFLDMAAHPRWWFNLATTEPLAFESLRPLTGPRTRPVGTLYDPGLSFAELAWLRERWHGKLVLKGIQSVADARTVVDAGADAVVLSSHGGRQLEFAPAPLELLPGVAEELRGQAEIIIDSGILTGTQMIAAVGLGATAVMVGRAYLYGLMAAGEAGVDKMLGLFEADARRTLQLMGARNLDEVRGRVRLR